MNQQHILRGVVLIPYQGYTITYIQVGARGWTFTVRDAAGYAVWDYRSDKFSPRDGIARCKAYIEAGGTTSGEGA